MTGHADDMCSSNSLIYKGNRLLSQQLSVWWKASTNVIVILVLAYKATSVSKAQSAFRRVQTYGVDERLLKYCFLGSSSRFSTYTISVRSDNSASYVTCCRTYTSLYTF